MGLLIAAPSLLLELLSGAPARTQDVPTTFKSNASVGAGARRCVGAARVEEDSWSFFWKLRCDFPCRWRTPSVRVSLRLSEFALEEAGSSRASSGRSGECRGAFANRAIWSAADATELHEAIQSLAALALHRRCRDSLGPSRPRPALLTRFAAQSRRVRHSERSVSRARIPEPSHVPRGALP